jgi:hypothetical protein
MVELLERNPDLSRFFLAVIDHLVVHCNATGKDFRDLKIVDPFVSPDGYIRARVV